MLRLMCLLFLVTQTAFAADGSEDKGVEFRLVQEMKTADSQEYDYKESNKEQKAEKLYLSKESLLPEKPIDRAVAELDLQTGGFQITIKLTAEGTKKMAEVSRKYLNQRIALLVEGQVVIAPTMRAEIGSGDLKTREISPKKKHSSWQVASTMRGEKHSLECLSGRRFLGR